NNPLTLLVNSKTHGKVVLHMTFESATGQVRFPVKPTRVALEIGRCRINQQSLLWPGLIITRAWRSPRQADQAPVWPALRGEEWAYRHGRNRPPCDGSARAQQPRRSACSHGVRATRETRQCSSSLRIVPA